MELAFPGRVGTPGLATSGGAAFTYQEIDGFAVHDGDILLALRSDPAAPPSAGRSFATHRWADGVIPYTVDPSLPIVTTARFLGAIEHWSANTGFTFVRRTTEPDYLVILPAADGCSSYVGRLGGAQALYLGSGCTRGNTIHELGHVIGLWHEQSRQDASTYVAFHEENLEDPLYAPNFGSYTERGDDGTDLGPYDYGSILHYPSWAFADDEDACMLSNVGCTLTKPDGSHIDEYQRDALSPTDIWGANRLYFDTWQVSDHGTAPWREIALSDIPSSDVQIADVDGDGVSDVVSLVDGELVIRWGSGETTPVAAPNSIASFALADTDGDGAFEVITSISGRWRRWTASTARWDGWVARQVDVGAFEFADLDGDGRTDALRSIGGTWWVAWAGHDPVPLVDAPALARFADLDGDGAAEIVVDSDGWRAYSAVTDTWTTLEDGGALEQTFVADLDGDGRDSLVVMEGSTAHTLDADAWTLDTEGGVIRVGDFDGDGADDVFTSMAPRTQDPGADGIYEVPDEVEDLAVAIVAANSTAGEVHVGPGEWTLDRVLLEPGVSLVGSDTTLVIGDLTLDSARVSGVTLTVNGMFLAGESSLQDVAVTGAIGVTGNAMLRTTAIVGILTVDGDATLDAEDLEVQGALQSEGTVTLDRARLTGTTPLFVRDGATTCTNCLLEGESAGAATFGALDLVHTTIRAPTGVQVLGGAANLVNTALLEVTAYALFCTSGSAATTAVYADAGLATCGSLSRTARPEVDADGHLGDRSDLADVGVTTTVTTDRDGDPRPIGRPDVGCDEREP